MLLLLESLAICQALALGQSKLHNAKFNLLYSLLEHADCVLMNKSHIYLLAGALLEYLVDSATCETCLYLAAATLSVVTFLRGVVLNLTAMNMWRNTMELRSTVISMLYIKVLRLPRYRTLEIGSSKLQTLLSTDAERFTLAWTLHALWLAPIDITIVSYIGWIYVGPAIFAGMGVLLAILPLQIYVSHASSRLRVLTASATDERISTLRRILMSIRSIKIAALETQFEEQLKQARACEHKHLSSTVMLQAGVYIQTYGIATVCTFATIMSMLALGQSISAKQAFLILSLFGAIKLTLGYMLPTALQCVGELRVTMNRICEILDIPEDGICWPKGENPLQCHRESTKLNAEYGISTQSDMQTTNVKPTLTLTDMKCSWTESQLPLPLAGVSFGVCERSLTVITGATGSGKTMLLEAIAGESILREGSITSRGLILSAPQEACIISGTVRQNILFGQSYSAKVYKAVVKACELEADFSQLSRGDSTDVGDCGRALSGGQRARISFARLVYAAVIWRANSGCSAILLLDDPFAALDSQVATALYCQCIRGILRDHCIVLATHHTRFTSDADTHIDLTFRSNGELDNSACNLNSTESLEWDGSQDPSHELVRDSTSRICKGGVYAQSYCRNRQSGRESINYTAMLQQPSEIGRSESFNNEPRYPSDIGYQSYKLSHCFVPNDFRLGAGSGNYTLHGAATCRRSSPHRTSIISNALQLPPIAESQIEVSVDVQDNVFDTEESDTLSDSEIENEDGHDLAFENDSRNYSVEHIEEQVSGHVTKATLMQYFGAAAGLSRWTLIGLFMVLTTLLQVSCDILLTKIAISSRETQVNYSDQWVYVGFVVCFVITSYASSALFMQLCIATSTAVHAKATSGLLNTSLRFFDTNSIGRVLNRFSKDFGYVDSLLPLTGIDFFQLSLLCCATMVMASVVIPLVLGILLPAVIAFIALRQYYVNTAIAIKRMEGAARAPLYSHMAFTTNACGAIHSFPGAYAKFSQQFHKYQDTHSRVYFAFVVTSRWLGSRLDLIVTIVVTFMSFACVYKRDDIEEFLLCLALTYVIQLTGVLQWWIRQSVEFENQMTSCERIFQYSSLQKDYGSVACQTQVKGSTNISLPSNGNCLPIFGSGIIDGPFCMTHKTVDYTAWPLCGKLQMSNLYLQYDPSLGYALQNVSINIAHGRKVGIIGRSGSGKSSLVAALLRLAPTSGRVEIDNVPTCTVPLDVLRRAICVVSQDPVLFGGTLRDNIDPLHKVDDTTAYGALQDVGLDLTIREMGGLGVLTDSDKVQFSTGQRQLLCLARAIINKTHILVLDEATASLDYETDNIMQAVLEKCFADATVLVIAHRLKTVMNSDQVIIMRNGKIIEEGDPHTLMSDPNTEFSRMLVEAGDL